MLTALVLLSTAVVQGQPQGRRAALEGIEGAALFVPRDYQPGPGGVVDVVVHLHGASSVVEPALVEAGWPALLVTFNRKGLSSTYARPFSDPSLFPRLLDAALAAAKVMKVAPEPKLGRVVVSSFSAGFGGVREMLKTPATFDRIDGLVLADSLYCGYTGDPARKRVDPDLMAGFGRFAREAAAGRKAMLLTHSAQVPPGYASTTETADDLIAAVAAPARLKAETWAAGWTQTREASLGRFLVIGFAGAEAADHMSHLRQIARLWRRFRTLDH